MAIKLKLGTIVCYKKYGILKRMWYKLFGKKLEYNKFWIVTGDLDILPNGLIVDGVAYEPLKKYNKTELNSLYKLLETTNKCELRFADIKAIINNIRPNTLTDTITLDECKYYKKVKLDANALEYIHVAE